MPSHLQNRIKANENTKTFLCAMARWPDEREAKSGNWNVGATGK